MQILLMPPYHALNPNPPPTPTPMPFHNKLCWSYHAFLQGWPVLQHTRGPTCAQKPQSCMTSEMSRTALPCVRIGIEEAPAAGVSSVGLLMAYMKSGEPQIHLRVPMLCTLGSRG